MNMEKEMIGLEFGGVADEVLETSLPFVKTRRLVDGTAESRAKARRSSEFLQPYRARPETCPALARRLVTSALGVKLSTARQEREAEKALLKVARGMPRSELSAWLKGMLFFAALCLIPGVGK